MGPRLTRAHGLVAFPILGHPTNYLALYRSTRLRACAEMAHVPLLRTNPLSEVKTIGTFCRRSAGRPQGTDPARRPLTTPPAALPASVPWGPPAAAAMRMRIRLDPGDVDRPVARAARAGPLTLVPGPTAR